MSENSLVTPLIVDANATLAQVAALVEAAKKAEWVLLRATSGFTVSWYLLRFSDLVSSTTDPFDPKQTIAQAVGLQSHMAVPAVPLGTEDAASAPAVVLAGSRVFGLKPPIMRAAQSPRRSARRGATRSRGATARAKPPGLSGGAAASMIRIPPTRIDAAAYIDAPRTIIQKKKFTMEIGLAETPSPDVINGQVGIDFQENETEVTLDVHLQCEGFTCDEGADQPLIISRNDPFTPRLTFHLASTALAEGVADELRAIQVSYAVRGRLCGLATWKILVQRKEAAVDLPVATPTRVAINTGAPDIDLTLTSAWKDDTEASQTLCWTYSTPHALPEPQGKLTHSSPALAALPLAIVDELAQNDGQPGIELTMKGLAKRIAAEIPLGVWEVLRSVTDAVQAARGKAAVPTVLIVTAETRVPWELAALPKQLFPAPAGAPELRTIGTEYIVSRWLLDDMLPPVPPHRVVATDVVAVYGDYTNTQQAQLPFAKKEAEYLEQECHGIPFTADRDTIVKILSGTQQTPAGADLAPKILHFAGHGEAARPGTPTSFIVLNDGSSFSTTGFLGAEVFEKHRPLVFLNACQLAAAVESLGQPGGFAVIFVRAECSAVVAPLWSVNDQVAYDVAKHFYDAILEEGQSPAAAMWQARQPRFTDLTVTDANGNSIKRRTATRMAYLVYGHPSMTFGS
jgi:hypothetical protein